MTSRSRTKFKGDGTDAYGRMTKATLLKKIADVNQECRRLKNAEHDKVAPLEIKVGNLEAERQKLQGEVADLKNDLENQESAGNTVIVELAKIRAARALSDAELMALAADVFAEGREVTESRKKLQAELHRRGLAPDPTAPKGSVPSTLWSLGVYAANEDLMTRKK